jgi:hypothetical protein
MQIIGVVPGTTDLSAWYSSRMFLVQPRFSGLKVWVPHRAGRAVDQRSYRGVWVTGGHVTRLQRGTHLNQAATRSLLQILSRSEDGYSSSAPFLCVRVRHRHVSHRGLRRRGPGIPEQAHMGAGEFQWGTRRGIASAPCGGRRKGMRRRDFTLGLVRSDLRRSRPSERGGTTCSTTWSPI